MKPFHEIPQRKGKKFFIAQHKRAAHTLMIFTHFPSIPCPDSPFRTGIGSKIVKKDNVVQIEKVGIGYMNRLPWQIKNVSIQKLNEWLL